MKVTVFGSGYVGLVTAVCFADVGNEVLCIDVDREKVASLSNGVSPIYEPGLTELLKKNLLENRLRFSTDAAGGVAHGVLQFIAVGTPPNEDGSADLRYVLEVAETIATHMDGYRVIISKSTVPVGTADKVRDAIQASLKQRGDAIEFDVVSNPEFLKEGNAIGDFNRPDRIILGSDSARATRLMQALYAPFNRNSDRLQIMDVRSSELTKYAANAMLATKISFMNELANLAENLGADIEKVRLGIGADPRIGYHFIYPGCGYGGSCFPKDVKALIKSASDAQFDAVIMKAVEAVNNHQKGILYRKLRKHLGVLEGKTVAIWGLAFKPKTDDMREAPSQDLIEALLADGCRVKAYDPVAMDEADRIFGARAGFALATSPLSAASGADALAVVTEWRVFQSPNLEELRGLMNQPLIVDGRNLYDPSWMRESGFTYDCVGRPLAAFASGDEKSD